MRTILRFVTLLALALVLCAGNAWGEKWEEYHDGAVKWEYEEIEMGKTCRIKLADLGDFTGTELPVPSVVKDANGGAISVVEIAAEAFALAWSVKKVVIPEGVLAIGKWAFAHTSLLSVDIPASVVLIVDGAFDQCRRLQELTVAPGNKKFSSADGVLFSADGKRLLFYPMGKKGEYAIPEGTEIIEDKVFEYRSELQAVTLPASLKTIGRRAFASSGVKKIVCPSGLTQIGDDAFSYCGSLQEATIGGKGTKVGKGAFYDSRLKTVNITGQEVIVEASAFYGCREMEDLTISGSVSAIGKEAFFGCSALKKVLFSEGLTAIGEGAFSNCSALVEVKLPNSLLSIGPSAFSLAGLESINIPSGVVEIVEGAFYCPSLKEITVDAANTSYCIHSGVLYSKDMKTLICCPAMKDGLADGYVVPEGVKAIGRAAFYGCKALATVSLPEGLARIGYNAFTACESLTRVNVPRSVLYVGGYAFSDCDALKEVFWWPNVGIAVGSNIFERSNSSMQLYVRKGEGDKANAKEDWRDYGAQPKVVEGFVVTFADETGEELGQQEVMSGQMAIAPDTPVRAGYSFKGWYNGTTQYDFNAPVKSDITLTQKWEQLATPPADVFTVTFSSEGGAMVSSQVVKKGERATKPANPIRTGYAFKGWFADNGTGEYNFDTPVQGNLTLQASWKAIYDVLFHIRYSYRVTVVKVLDKNGRVVAEALVREEKAALPIEEGEYTYVVTSEGCKEAKGDITVQKGIGTIELKLEALKFTVTFDAAGGEPEPAVQERQFGWLVEEPRGDMPQRKGFVFDGWYLNGKKYDFATPVTSNITLVAQWKDDVVTPKHTVTFNADGGAPEPMAQKVLDGETVKEPSGKLEKHGFIFDGWYLNGNKYDFEQPVKADITLKAQWKDDGVTPRYTVTFDADGGSPVPAAQTIVEGEKAKEPADKPEKSSFTFEGWYLDGSKYDFEQPVKANITLVAQWKEVKKTAVESVLLAGIRLVANPIGNVLVLEGLEAAERVEVYSLQGVRINTQMLRGEHRVEMATESWPSGVYVVRMVAKDGERTLRVVKR